MRKRPASFAAVFAATAALCRGQPAAAGLGFVPSGKAPALAGQYRTCGTRHKAPRVVQVAALC